MVTTVERSRREAIVAGSLWTVFAIWVVTVSYYLGYVREVQTTTFGLPTWIVWGVLVPWVVAVIANTLFAWLVLADDE